jgi:alkylation response protein AidB-like acyl-CoA dehydrogenase
MDWMGLKEEHKMLRHDVKRFAETELEPTALELDRQSTAHAEAFAKIGQLGILGILIPEQYGGAEMDLLALIVTIEELAKASPSFALSVAAHNLAGDILVMGGSDEVKQRFLPKLAEGKSIAGLGMDTMLSATDEAKEKGKFVVNGSFSHLNVYGIQNEGERVFVIEEAGSESKADTELMGMRASGISTVFPKGTGDALTSFQMDDPATFFSKLRLVLGSVSCGICGAALTHSISYAKERQQFGRPIASFGMIRIMLAEMAARTDAARMLIYQAAADGTPLERDMSAAFAVEHALAVTDHGVQVYGGYGYTKDYPLEMLFRDAKVLEIFAGSAEYLKETIGRQLTK